MSAATQNYVYLFGKKRDDKNENVISKQKLEEIKASTEKYFKDKKDK